MKNYESLKYAMPDIKRSGYTEGFQILPDCLLCRTLGLRFGAREFTVDEIYRFELNAKLNETRILHLISCRAGINGFLLDAYGTCAKNMRFDMAIKLRLFYVW